MELNFTISELCILDQPIPQSVADKLLYHIQIIQPIRTKLGVPIRASEKSGYRPYEYEKLQGRSGNSQHTFKGKGAVDWTCSCLDDLHNLLIYSAYKRLCKYPTFIHCDFASDEKQYFVCTNGGNWQRI